MAETNAVEEHGERMYQMGNRHGTDNGWHACIELVHDRWNAAREAGADKAIVEALYETYLAMTDAAPWAAARTKQS